jgi:hypothetical protein
MARAALLTMASGRETSTFSHFAIPAAVSPAYAGGQPSAYAGGQPANRYCRDVQKEQA